MMKKKTGKSLSLLLVICLVSALLPQTLLAEAPESISAQPITALYITVKEPATGLRPPNYIQVRAEPEGCLTREWFRAVWIEGTTGNNAEAVPMTSEVFEEGKYYFLCFPYEPSIRDSLAPGYTLTDVPRYINGVGFSTRQPYIARYGPLPEITYHTVTFDGNGHGEPEPILLTVPHGGTVWDAVEGEPPWLYTEDKVFMEWSLDSDNDPEKRFDLNTPITEDICLYAIWLPRLLLVMEDNSLFDVAKVMRWYGMHGEFTGEPEDRGYNPNEISFTLRVMAYDEPMIRRSTADVGEDEQMTGKLSYYRPLHYYWDDTMLLDMLAESAVRYTANGWEDVHADISLWDYDETFKNYYLTVYTPCEKGGDRLLLKAEMLSGIDGEMLLRCTSFAPGCIRMTLCGEEYAIVTPGDVNLDGRMNANDWANVMRWTLEAPNRFDTLPTDPHYTVGINRSQYNLWLLMADMDGKEPDPEAVDANDWLTMIYLTLEGWKH